MSTILGLDAQVFTDLGTFVHVGVVITLRVTYIINLQFDWLTYLYAISLGA